MGMTLKEMLRKGASDGTVNADEVRALAQECGLDTESLYTLLEERGIKIQENEASLDVDSILAEVENAEANASDDYDEPEEDHLEENPADLKAAMDELLDMFSQVFARLLAGTAQVVGALPGCGLFTLHSAFW